MDKRKKRDNVLIGGIGSSALEYSAMIFNTVNEIVKKHPEVGAEDIYVGKDEEGRLGLFFDRYMTDIELAKRQNHLNELANELEEMKKESES